MHLTHPEWNNFCEDFDKLYFMRKILLTLTVFSCAILNLIAQQNTIKKYDVTLGPEISKKLNNPRESLVMILTYKSPQEAREARQLLQVKGIQFVGPKFEELPIQGIKATISDIDWLCKIKGAFGIWEKREDGNAVNGQSFEKFKSGFSKIEVTSVYESPHVFFGFWCALRVDCLFVVLFLTYLPLCAA